MFRRVTWLAIAALCLSASPTLAQSGREQADTLIKESGHPQLFQNISADEAMAVLHLASGMKCDFTPGSPDNMLRVYNPDPKEEDVGCSSSFGGTAFSSYASRYEDMPPARDLAVGAMQAIAQRFPSIRDYEGEAVEMSSEDLPERVTGRFVVDINGEDYLTKVIVSNVDNWSFKQRMTAPLTAAPAADLESELYCVALLMRVTLHLQGADGGEGAQTGG